MTPEQHRLSAIVAALSRHKPASRELIAARENFLAAKVEQHALAVAAHTPNLRPEQRQVIAAILRPILSDGMAASA
jgi:multisubunit Na+/H+ antiporter MnhG subunit